MHDQTKILLMMLGYYLPEWDTALNIGVRDWAEEVAGKELMVLAVWNFEQTLGIPQQRPKQNLNS